MNKNLLQLATVIGFLALFAHPTRAQWVQTRVDTTGPGSIFPIHALAANGGHIFAGTEGGGIFLSTDSGTSWKAINNGLTYQIVEALAVNGDYIFTGNDYGGIFLSTNNGTSWTYNGFRGNYIGTLAWSGSMIFAGSSWDGIFLSKDSGTTWNAVNSGLTRLDIYTLAVTGSNIFAGTGGGVFISTDSGASWSVFKSGIPNDSGIGVLAASGDNIFAATLGGVFISTASSVGWNFSDSGLAGKYIFSLAISGDKIFAGTWGGVFLSTDSGVSWNAINTGFTGTGNEGYYSLAVSGGYIFAGSEGGVVWRRPLSDFATAVLPQKRQSNCLQTKIWISASNAGHSGVTLAYGIQSSMFVELELYTISGKKVVLLEQGDKAAGEYSINVDSGKLPAGIYVYRFKAGDYAESSRFILAK